MDEVPVLMITVLPSPPSIFSSLHFFPRGDHKTIGPPLVLIYPNLVLIWRSFLFFLFSFISFFFFLFGRSFLFPNVLRWR